MKEIWNESCILSPSLICLDMCNLEREVKTLEKAGIKATIIGKATAGNDRVLLNEDERRFLEPPKTDELYKVIGR